MGAPAAKGTSMQCDQRQMLQRVASMALFVVLLLLAGCGQTGAPPNAYAHGDHYSESPAVRRPDVSGMRVAVKEALEPPSPAYPFDLIAQSGSGVRLQDLEGKVVVLSFLYTNCPEACPLLTEHYLTLQRRFADALAQEELALVLVTTDPERDTPERLRAYTAGKGGKWLFLTGTEKTLQPVWEQFDVYRELRKELAEIVVYHSYKTFVIDKQSNIRLAYTGVWFPDDVAPELARLLQEHEPM